MSDSSEMSTVVQKYGGSSVADPERLGRVADRVAETARAGHRVVVVVSAMGKTTDELYALARAVAPSPSRRELDMLLSCGERISMALLAMALEHRGLAAISFTGSQSGIITDDRHTGARIVAVRPVRIVEALDHGRIVIVAGFQGVSEHREVTTLGRGGSDTTAVAMAAALGAAWCEICSDVDGVYSADPRVVPEAHRLDEISYGEMSALASHGARVLNAEAVAWAERAGIELLARATTLSPLSAGGRPEGGTRVGRAIGRAIGRAGPRAVTGTRVVTVVHGIEALTIAAEERLPLRSVHGHELRFVRDDVPDWPRIAARFAQVREVGEVTLVGPGIAADAGLVRLAASGALAVSAAGSAITLDVPTDRVDDMARALHESLVVR